MFHVDVGCCGRRFDVHCPAHVVEDIVVHDVVFRGAFTNLYAPDFRRARPVSPDRHVEVRDLEILDGAVFAAPGFDPGCRFRGFQFTCPSVGVLDHAVAATVDRDVFARGRDADTSAARTAGPAFGYLRVRHEEDRDGLTDRSARFRFELSSDRPAEADRYAGPHLAVASAPVARRVQPGHGVGVGTASSSASVPRASLPHIDRPDRVMACRSQRAGDVETDRGGDAQDRYEAEKPHLIASWRPSVRTARLRSPGAAAALA